MFFVVENVNYERLASHRGLRKSFVATVTTEVAAKAGVPEDSVEVTLSPGSVNVRSKIVLPLGSTAADLEPVMQNQSMNLTSTLVAEFATFRDWFLVTTGDVSISTPKLVQVGVVSTTVTTTSTVTTRTTTTTTTSTTTSRRNISTTLGPTALTDPDAGKLSLLGLSETSTLAAGGSALAVVALALIVCTVSCSRYCRKGPRKSVEGNAVFDLFADDKVKEEEGKVHSLASPGGASSLPSVRQPESEAGTSPAQAQFQHQAMLPPHGQQQWHAGFDEFGQPVIRPPSYRGLEDGPGSYRIVVEGTALGPTCELGDVIAELAAGEVVEVLQVEANREATRLRGRLRSPAGWLSIRSLEADDARRWAERVGEAGSPGSAASMLPLSPSGSAQGPFGGSQHSGVHPVAGMMPAAAMQGGLRPVGLPGPMGMGPPGQGMAMSPMGPPGMAMSPMSPMGPPGLGMATSPMGPPGMGPPGLGMAMPPMGPMMAPGLRPMWPGGMAPQGMAPQGVAPWGRPSSRMSGMTPVGQSSQSLSEHMAQSQSVVSTPMSSTGLAGSLLPVDLPGGFAVGDRVVAMVDFTGASGSVSIGEEGVIAGPCRGLPEERAKNRVNCRFPRHTNINLKVTQVRSWSPGMAPQGVAPWGPSSRMSGMTPVGQSSQSLSEHLAQSQSVVSTPMSSTGLAGSLLPVDLPGGFAVDDRVVAMVDFTGASGSVSIGEEGVIAGPCRGLPEERAKNRVNCRFPRHANINLKVTQVRRADDQV